MNFQKSSKKKPPLVTRKPTQEDCLQGLHCGYGRPQKGKEGYLPSACLETGQDSSVCVITPSSLLCTVLSIKLPGTFDNPDVQQNTANSWFFLLFIWTQWL